MYVLDLLVEELIEADPPLAANSHEGGSDIASCVGACRQRMLQPTREERVGGVRVEWAILVASDRTKTCGHWISWECLVRHVGMGETGVEAAVADKLVRCPQCRQVVGDYYRAPACGRKV